MPNTFNYYKKNAHWGGITGDINAQADLMAAIGGGGGGGDFRVTFSADPETQEITCDKTMAEIRAAVLSGKRPYGVLSREEGDFMFFDLVSSWTPDEEIRTDTYCFQNIIGSEYIQITMHDFEDTGIDVTTGEFQQV